MATEVRDGGVLVGAQGSRWSVMVVGEDVVVNVAASFDETPPPMGEGVVVDPTDLSELAAALTEIAGQ